MAVYLDEQFRKDSLPDNQNNLSYENFNYRSNDFWAGHAFKVFKGNSIAARTTNIITSVRYLNVKYKKSPDLAYDSINYFSNENFYFGRVALSSRQYIKDTYIYRDGTTEDVPVGFVTAITSGYQRKNKENRFYIGTNVTVAKYLKWGYFSGSIGYETFFNHSKTEQTTINIGATYFSHIIPLDPKWNMRQFVKPQLNLGFNRLNTLVDRVSLNENSEPLGHDINYYKRSNYNTGISGYDTDYYYGTKKILLATQTQFYSPWNIYGFRLNPYLNVTAGTIADKNTSLLKSKIYSSFGIGFIIRNDYLVFSSFQLSLSYYPEIFNEGKNIIKTNAFETDDFGFQSINTGKPSSLLY